MLHRVIYASNRVITGLSSKEDFQHIDAKIEKSEALLYAKLKSLYKVLAMPVCIIMQNLTEAQKLRQTNIVSIVFIFLLIIYCSLFLFALLVTCDSFFAFSCKLFFLQFVFLAYLESLQGKGVAEPPSQDYYRLFFLIPCKILRSVGPVFCKKIDTNNSFSMALAHYL